MTSQPLLDEDARFSLGVISGKLDLLLVQGAATQAANDARFTKLEDCQDDHDTRISSLEQGRSWVLGGAATVTAAVGTIFAYLGLK